MVINYHDLAMHIYLEKRSVKTLVDLLYLNKENHIENSIGNIGYSVFS